MLHRGCHVADSFLAMNTTTDAIFGPTPWIQTNSQLEQYTVQYSWIGSGAQGAGLGRLRCATNIFARGQTAPVSVT
jgi:hypothetical protein